MWVILAILSALCLGFYDISKKRSLRDNSVPDVLTISLLISSAILAIPLGLSRFCPEMMEGSIFYVPRVGLTAHLFIFLKSCIVLSSWVCAYVAIKYLPISVVSPMQATRPMWTLIGALLIFGERLNGWQWAGVVCALGSIFAFSLAEHHTEKGDIHTPQNQRKYYICLLLAILIGSASGLYDKYMMRRFDHNAVQVYYTFYQALMMGVVTLIANRKRSLSRSAAQSAISFHWTWAIAGISVFLVLSDYVYMLALSDTHSLISVVSTIRRGGTIIPFLYGILVLKEKDPWKKVLCLIGIVIGLLFLAAGSYA